LHSRAGQRAVHTQYIHTRAVASYVVLRLPLTLVLLSSWLRDTVSHSFRVFIISIMYMALQAYNSCKQYTRFCDFSIHRACFYIHRTTECIKYLKILQSSMVERRSAYFYKAECRQRYTSAGIVNLADDMGPQDCRCRPFS
jgi:hypothetical protein